ncbi:MAG: PP2C family protein-serine/threonine phosphatase [Actinomycetota bacterium]
MSLRWKLVGGFSVLLLLVVVLGWLTLSLFGSLRSVQREVFRRAIPELVAVDEIVRSFTAQSAAVRGYLISSDPDLLDQYESEVDTADEWEARALDLLEGADERADLEELISTGDGFQALVDEEVVPLAADGQRSQAFRVLGQEGTPLISNIERLGEALRLAQDEVVVAAEAEVRRRQNQAIAILILVFVAMLVVGLALAIMLPRRLVRNLDKLVDAARGIGRGDFNQRLEISSGDEVEELASRFIEMQSGLKRLQQLALQDRELEIAASVQRNLLQRQVPDIPGVRLWSIQRQANLVGGDWYDIEVSQRTLTVAVGDASGKGIAAAMMATVALSSLRAERSLGAGPKRVIESANKTLRDATDPDSFTTLIYLTLDLRTGEVRWLNMGHPSPFVLRTSSEEASGYFVEGPRNKALGWFDEPGLAETVLGLEPHDRLIVFTDGFVEAKSSDGELFGEDRLAELLLRLAPLDPATLEDELIGEVERFATGKLGDDLTMLVVEYQGTDG